MGAGERSEFTRTEIEGLLKAVLVPIEPDVQFIRRLKARLVRYEGRGMSPVWAVAAGLAVATLLVLTSLGIALRLLLALLSIFGERGGGRRAEGSTSVA